MHDIVGEPVPFKPDRPLLLSHLPKSLRDKPAIRALTLKVIEQGSHYIVLGRTRNYLVTQFQGAFQCDCLAAQSKTLCAHLIATRRHHERKTGMKVGAQRVTYEAQEYKQPIRLARGLYGGMLARYTAPKLYNKFGSSTEQEEKVFVSFVVTHDAAGRPLPKFSEAFTGIRTKLFYNESSNMMSTLVGFYAALLNGKMTPDQIVEASDDQLPDWDDLIGRPARLFIEPSNKPDRNGILVNKIDTQRGGFDLPDKDLIKAIKPLWEAKEIGKADDGRSYLKKPTAEYEDASVAHFTPNGNGAGKPASYDDLEDDSEIPF